jgi:hypothetical protein
VASASRIDISSEAVRIARGCRGVHAHQGDYLALNLARKLDVIAMGGYYRTKRPDLFIAKTLLTRVPPTYTLPERQKVVRAIMVIRAAGACSSPPRARPPS